MTDMNTVRIAAVGDLHIRDSHAGRFRDRFNDIASEADLLLLAGDLTEHGTLLQARILADEVSGVTCPIIAVLGNHDHKTGNEQKIVALWADAGITILDGDSARHTVNGVTIGVAGIEGCGGGFVDGTDIDPERWQPMQQAHRLAIALDDIDSCQIKIALTHYSPCVGTLRGEPEKLYDRLGSWRLGQVIDSAGVDLSIHGHAHHGDKTGTTTGRGVPVRNVARAVIKAPYRAFSLRPGRSAPKITAFRPTDAAIWAYRRYSDAIAQRVNQHGTISSHDGSC